KNKFNILFAFDFNSIIERKNPLSAIQAFKSVFKDNANIQFILKTTNAQNHLNKVDQIKKAIDDCQNILFFDGIISRKETWELINSCDVFFSLHRSEGLGLGLREAMSLGKIAIATAYSGNLDFMSENNSMLVKYNLIQIP